MLTGPWTAGCLRVTPTQEQRKLLFLAPEFHPAKLRGWGLALFPLCWPG